MDRAAPVRQSPELAPQFVWKRLLPRSHLFLKEEAKLHSQGVFGSGVLVAGRLINEGDQPNFGARCKEGCRACSDLTLAVCLEVPVFKGTHIAGADIEEGLCCETHDLPVRDLWDRKLHHE